MDDQGFRQAWTERAANYFSVTFGMAPVTGRLMAWLMICEPAEQSGSDLVTALGASRASITASLRLAHAAGFVSRRTHSGNRTVYYVIEDSAWSEVVRKRIANMGTFVQIADEALDQIDENNASTTRIRAARDVFALMGTLADHPSLNPTRKEKRK